MSLLLRTTSKFGNYPPDKSMHIKLLYAVTNLGLTVDNAWDFFEYGKLPGYYSSSNREDVLLFEKDVIDALPNAKPNDYDFYAHYLIQAFKNENGIKHFFEINTNLASFDKAELLVGFIRLFDKPYLTEKQKDVIINTVVKIDSMLEYQAKDISSTIRDKIKAAISDSTYKEWRLQNITYHLPPDDIRSIRAWLQGLENASKTFEANDRIKLMQVFQDPKTLEDIKDLILTKDLFLQPYFLDALKSLIEPEDIKKIESKYNLVTRKDSCPLLGEILFAIDLTERTKQHTSQSDMIERLNRYSKYKTQIELLTIVNILKGDVQSKLTNNDIQAVVNTMDRITHINKNNNISSLSIMHFLQHDSSEIRLKTVQKIVQFRSQVPNTLLRAVKKINGVEQYGTGLNIANAQSFKRFIGCYAPEWKKLVNVHEKLYGNLMGVEALIAQQSCTNQTIDALDLDQDDDLAIDL